MNKITKIILFALGTLLFCYTATKAFLLSITWDEAYSYTEFISKGICFEENIGSMSANNHLLLTFLDIQLVKWFGVNEIILRMPVLLSHLLFLIYSAKLVAHFENRWLIISSFLIINLNPYLLDFFSLARGYGLSMGMMMASIYYLYLFQKSSENKFAIYAMLFGALGVLSNYVVLNYYLGAFSCIFILTALRAIYSKNSGMEKKSFWKNIAIPFLILLLLLIFVIPITFELREVGALYFGADNGFWEDTVHKIIYMWFYESYVEGGFTVVASFIIFILSAAVVLVVMKLVKKQFTLNNSFLIVILGICFFCITSTIAQHMLLGTLYLIDRTALFFTVLFPIILVFFVKELTGIKPRFAIINYVSLLIVMVHSVRSFSMDHIHEWKTDADTKQMLCDLEKIKQVSPEKGNISINVPLLFEAGINFYRSVDHLTWLNIATRAKKINLSDDYCFLSPNELTLINPDSLEILKKYPVTGSVLAIVKNRWKHPRISVHQELKFEDEPQKHLFMNPETEYSKSITFLIPDSLATNKRNMIVFEVVGAPAGNGKNDVKMVISFDGVDSRYLSVSLMDYFKKKEEWEKGILTMPIPETFKAGDNVSVYVWNPNKQEAYIKELSFKWLRYD